MFRSFPKAPPSSFLSARLILRIAPQQDDLTVRPGARPLPNRFEHVESRGSLDRVNPNALGGVYCIALLFRGHVRLLCSGLSPKEIVGRRTVFSASSRPVV